MKRIVAVNSNCYHGYSLEDAIGGISNAGFHYIELTATKGWTEHVFPTMSLNYLWEIKDKLEDANLFPFSSQRAYQFDGYRTHCGFHCEYAPGELFQLRLHRFFNW